MQTNQYKLYRALPSEEALFIDVKHREAAGLVDVKVYSFDKYGKCKQNLSLFSNSVLLSTECERIQKSLLTI